MPDSARHAAALALTPACQWFPDLSPGELHLAGLSAADARLATAIHRTSIQRWITLEYLLDRHLKQPMGKLSPAARAVLLSAAAQLVFMDRLPGYAVIDEAVRLARKLDQPHAAGMVNAVLRKLDALVEGPSDGPWEPSRRKLPLMDGKRPGGGAVNLRGDLLPKTDNLLAHLVVATSHPLPLLQRWFKLFGRERATRLALHSLTQPPTFIIEHEAARPWEGSHDELAAWLAEDPTRRVQDPASLASVASLRGTDLKPLKVLDLCAGRGTKSRQLRALYPQARIVAHDPDSGRLADLHAVAGLAGLEVREPREGESFDLIVLDVPCSNTGVLARRPEARYRPPRKLESLIKLQREIIDRAVPLLASGGSILYCTCSLDPAENREQAEYLEARLREQLRGENRFIHEATLLPEASVNPGAAPGGHDGSYHALVGPG